MLDSFIVIGKHTKMDFGDFGVNEETAEEVADLLLKLTTTKEGDEELVVKKGGINA